MTHSTATHSIAEPTLQADHDEAVEPAASALVEDVSIDGMCGVY
jgi:mycofactocin precursor